MLNSTTQDSFNKYIESFMIKQPYKSKLYKIKYCTIWPGIEGTRQRRWWIRRRRRHKGHRDFKIRLAMTRGGRVREWRFKIKNRFKQRVKINKTTNVFLNAASLCTCSSHLLFITWAPKMQRFSLTISSFSRRSSPLGISPLEENKNPAQFKRH